MVWRAKCPKFINDQLIETMMVMARATPKDVFFWILGVPSKNTQHNPEMSNGGIIPTPSTSTPVQTTVEVETSVMKIYSLEIVRSEQFQNSKFKNKN